MFVSFFDRDDLKAQTLLFEKVMNLPPMPSGPVGRLHKIELNKRPSKTPTVHSIYICTILELLQYMSRAAGASA